MRYRIELEVGTDSTVDALATDLAQNLVERCNRSFKGFGSVQQLTVLREGQTPWRSAIVLWKGRP